MRLLDYYPPVLRDFQELGQITSAEQPEFDRLIGKVNTMAKEFTVFTASEYGIARLERLYGVVPLRAQTLEARREAVLAKMLARIPYTKIMLERMLSEVCGAGNYRIFIDYAGYKLTISIALAYRELIRDIRAFLRLVIPANLLFGVQIVIEDFVKESERFSPVSLAIRGRANNHMVRPKRFEGHERFNGAIDFNQQITGTFILRSASFRVAAANQNSGKVELTTDTHYNADGAYQFNGVRRFNAAILKEEL